MILLKFQYTKEESDMCKGELQEFTLTLRHEREQNEAWGVCGSNLGWHKNWPKLMQPWQNIIILNPSSKAICGREFFKKNAINSHLHNKLNLKTLDTLMRVLSMWAWNGCNGLGYNFQHLEKHARPKDTYARLRVFFVTNQEFILIIQNITLSKIMCNPKLR